MTRCSVQCREHVDLECERGVSLCSMRGEKSEGTRRQKSKKAPKFRVKREAGQTGYPDPGGMEEAEGRGGGRSSNMEELNEPS